MKQFLIYVALGLLILLTANTITWNLYVLGASLPEVLPPKQFDRIAWSVEMELWRAERDTLLGCQESVAFLRDMGCR